MAAVEQRPARVIPVLAVGLLSISASPLLVRFASEGPGLAIAVWRTCFAAVLLLPIALPRVLPELRRFSRRDYALIGGAGVVLGLHFITWIESLYHTSVASASVLVASSPIFLAVLGWLLLRERVSLRVGVAIVLSVAGGVLIGLGDATGGSGSAPLLGNSLALTAALLVSIYLIIGRVVRQHTSWLAYVFPLYSVVALTTLVAAWIGGTPLLGFSWTFYGLCLLMAIGPQLLGHGSFNYAVRYLPAALIGVLSLLEPVLASIAAYFLFDEVPTWLALTGMLIVLGAVVLAMLPRRRRTPRSPGSETAPVADR